jgi:RHS repeat-associated protein
MPKPASGLCNRAYAQVVKETNATTGNITDYLYGDDLIKQTRAANDSYYLYDGLGSTRALTDATGSIINTYNYEAFGDVLNQTGTTQNNYLFTGEQYDAALDMTYLRARYYDHGSDRFTQQDTYPGIINDPVSLHKYLYANIDPVNNIDPTGKFSIGSLMTAVNIATTLASRAQTAYTLFSLATGDEEVTANQIGSAIIVGMLGKGAGKIIGLVGGKVAKECLLKNSFVEGTLVSSENGLVNIESIEIGDKVWAYNEETNEKTLQEVVHLIQGEGEKELVEIKLASGETIVATANHPFYVPQLNDPWVDAFDLAIDNILFNNEQNPVVINSIERETKKAKVYNLTVANDHTYYVSKEPVLVHNCGFIGKSVRSILQGGMRNDKRLRKKKGNQFVGKSGGLQQAEEEFRLMSKRFSVQGSFKVTPNGSYNVTFKDGTVMTLKRSAEKPTIYLKIEGKTDAFRYYID